MDCSACRCTTTKTDEMFPLEKGHTRQGCTSAVDRNGRCYRCDVAGHTASSCTATPKCPLCRNLYMPAGHRLSSIACALLSKRRKNGAPINAAGSARTKPPSLPQREKRKEVTKGGEKRPIFLPSQRRAKRPNSRRCGRKRWWSMRSGPAASPSPDKHQQTLEHRIYCSKSWRSGILVWQ